MGGLADAVWIGRSIVGLGSGDVRTGEEAIWFCSPGLYLCEDLGFFICREEIRDVVE